MTTSFDNEAYAVGPGPWFCDSLVKPKKKETATSLSFLRGVPGLAGISCCADTTDAAKTGDDLSSQSTISETSQDAALPPVASKSSTEKKDSTATTSWTKPWVCFIFDGMDKVMFDLDGLCGTKSQSTTNEVPPPTIDILAEERCVTPVEDDKHIFDGAVLVQPFLEMEPHSEVDELDASVAVDTAADAKKDQAKASECQTVSSSIEGVLEVQEKPKTVTVTLDPPANDDTEEIRRYLMQAKSIEDRSEPQEGKQEDGEVDNDALVTFPDEGDVQGQSKLEFDEVQSSTTQTQVSCVVIFHNMATGSFCEYSEPDPIDAIAAEPEQEDDDKEQVREEDEKEVVQNDQDEELLNGDESIPDPEVKSEEPQPTCCPMATVMEVEEEAECESKDTAEVEYLTKLNIVEKVVSEDDEESPGCTTDDKDSIQSESSVSINANEKEQMPTIDEKYSIQSDSSVSTDLHQNDIEPVLRVVSLAVGRELDEDECYDSCEEESTEGGSAPKDNPEEEEPEYAPSEEPIEPKDSPEEQEAEHATSEGPVVRMVSLVTGVFDSIDSVVPFN